MCNPGSAKKQLIEKAAKITLSKETIACTSCRYCVDGCPQKIGIPSYFTLMNDLSKFGKSYMEKAKMYYRNYTNNMGMGKASQCIKCGQCESHCPQHLPITKYLEDTAATLEA